MKVESLLRRLLAPSLLLALAACQSDMHADPPPPLEDHHASISNEIQASAEVVELDQVLRTISLRRSDGTVFSLVAGPEVRNFRQIKVGDELKVNYRETLSATILPRDTVLAEAEGALTAGRANAGAKPGAGVGLAFRFPVQIESIDQDRDIVVFSLASGELIARRIQTAEGRRFVEKLSIGDKVQLEYKEALVLGIKTPY